MTNKQPKLYAPTEKDMQNNPMIGGSKGATMAGISPEDLEDAWARTRSKATSRTT